jgi:Rap1a immunity proteins
MRESMGAKMKLVWVVWVCLALVVASSSRASADLLNVQTLYFSCKEPEHSFSYGTCTGFVTGVRHTMQVVGYEQAKHPDQDYLKVAICGEKITGGAMVQAFKNWAEKNPRRWPTPHVMDALRETWPCAHGKGD